MTYFTTNLSTTLRTIAGSLQYPVILILLILGVFCILMLGSLLCEYFTEHRHLKEKLPALLDELHRTVDMAETISTSRLLLRQRKALLELTKHRQLPEETLNALAIQLTEDEESYYARKVKRSDLIAKLAPMFGLLGTLIPLGPGIIALGQGDTYTLSLSLLTAFDTTIVGLICAAVAVVISTIRKRWYARYMSVLRAIMECVLEEVIRR